MGKVNRLHDRIEPLAALFWLSRQCTVLGNILTLLSGPISLRRTPSMFLYGQAAVCTVVDSWFNSQRRRAWPPTFT